MKGSYPDQFQEARATQRCRLTDAPNWFYLLREFYEMYRSSSAGGNNKIRSHQLSVRGTISKIRNIDPDLVLAEPVSKPVCAHLQRALNQGKLGQTSSVILAIELISHQLTWQYGYDRVPKHMLEKFAFAEIVGPSGPIVSDQLIMGLVLFAPKCVYPTHSHDGLTESYYCISGAVSENDDGVFAPGSLIFNPPGRSHRITVDAREPCLLAYAWEGPADKLTNQKMLFSRNRSTKATQP